MKIILSSEAISPPLTGIGRYTWELATRLPTVPGLLVRFYWQGRWIPDPALLLDNNHQHARRTWLQRQEPQFLRDARLKWNCKGAVFHGPNYFLPTCADIGIATIHDLSVFNYPETHPLDRIKQFEKHFQATLQKAEHLITDTEAIRQEVMATFSWPSERITAVHLGVSSCFKPRQQEETSQILSKYGLVHGMYCLCVSTIEPRKKIDNLLTAYSRLPLELRKCYPLVLLGSIGWKSEAVHQQIKHCCAEGWLYYHGFVPEADLPTLYAAARLFVFPSIYEGFGLPVLEAMTSGVPVVTSNRSSLPEVTSGAAQLIDPDDIVMLAESIQKGLCDDDWRITAREKGLTVSKGHSWQRCIDETVQVYNTVKNRY